MIALSIAMGGALGAFARFMIHQYMVANGLGAVGLSTFTVNAVSYTHLTLPTNA